ncbi:uncharacterized protein LOC129000561 [Macrosteles quadrilineatus]|uniref:uncharacterized protein LOC129000561 n=1 Tax=Macrosteles quadrilineatus TaxID=74068 RepID=UPI0023E2C062|nr:uncharacterized protein LOC129000561 [Macrosteles quadrilineatus]
MAVAALPLLFGLAAASQDWSKVWSGVMDTCSNVSCVKGKVDLALDRALNMSTIPLVEGVTLVRTDHHLSPAGRQGGQDILSKFIHLVTTRNINIELGNVNGDGRGKKKKYLEYLYLAALVAAIVIPLKLQGLALVAGKALLIAKVALALAGSALLKKLSHDEHHRRVDVASADPYLLAYREQT